MGKSAKSFQQHLIHFLRAAPLLCMAAIAGYFLASGRTPDVDTLLRSVPDNYFLAVLFFFAVYAVKSLSVVFPIAVLYIAGGLLLPPLPALFLNIAGSMVCATIPYWVGYFSGGRAAQSLLRKHPKAAAFLETQQRSDWFTCYFLRVVNILPFDLVSMYLGSVQIPYVKYILGTTLGNLPSIIAITLVGANITNPASPAFLLSAAGCILLSLLSLLLYRWSARRRGRS